MAERHTVARTLHDAGLAAWFGGTLMGAVGVNGAAAELPDPRQRARAANAGWARWTPVNAVAIGAHLVGAVTLVGTERKRIAAQSGVLTSSIVKTALTAAALGTTAYSRVLGEKVIRAGDVPVAGGTDPLPSTPDDVAKAQRQLKIVQWVNPALLLGVVAATALQGEQMRPSEVAAGVAKRGAQSAVAAPLGIVTKLFSRG